MTKPVNRPYLPNGQPSPYDPKRYPALAEELALLGATKQEMATAFSVHLDTIYEWGKVHPAFSEAIARGTIQADAHMAKALYHRGLGYSHRAVKIFMPPGAEAPVYAPFTEHYPPDTNAASLWLRNRRGRSRKPDEAIAWSDRFDHEVSGSVALALLVEHAHALLGNEKPADDGKTIEHEPATEPDSGE